MKAYQDKTHEGNSAKYRTGQACIECDKPAGTAWSKLWCVDCNIIRMNRISATMDKLMEGLADKNELEGML